MPTHRAVQIRSPGGSLELVDVDTISPGPSEVRLDVAACGICGTDRAFVHDGFPDITWPLTPGHEIAGTIAEVGADVDDFVVGDRVAVGWFGGNCGHCIPCRKGIFIHCENLKVPSWQYPGGYAESVTVPASALARIPPELSFAEAAPMGCAGVTTYNALRHTKAVAGDRVAVLGVGGLGHLGVQFSRAMGFETVAIARGAGKTDDARRLGAHHYIDSTKNDVAEALRALGGVAVVLATAGNSAAMAATVGGLLPRGELVAIGVTTEPLPISPLQLINPGVSITGHPSGTARDVEETMSFAVLSGVRAWIEERPLSEAGDAYAAVEQGRPRYRVVLTM
ncbi:alcohol dehydrogenase catalytic domain-containing protein [Mycobacterium xenopi]|uniref:Alcohol dehydrogenase n=1 Tax=Mycobacterium xenopi TaxID=1789 RepID=A0AAD1H0N3_MYCXE|nr:alcohol dehydrogenase catalytic domain-containing protein [Mycobacterium xenopi]MDA3641663.1 alcohol dehydrogenase catalytic domain-containing protein [Mycobacterium xenopi]MDA3660167.1 alcohol dehydrogenase catalytic domain-containing protein [Mycobacterium xenopi]MDA3663889.1 alcohol dehydrogenase catalytic domain-containing protein [Mycobacterium xenopi]ORX13041.1 alcohol dehydrogenase [Mycobacterium xenopi]SPX92687.1 NADP-dependent alcohol dehydrogenase AdhC [Mycobacterium xenopi]